MRTRIAVAVFIAVMSVQLIQACPVKPTSRGKYLYGSLTTGSVVTFSGADSYDLSGRQGQGAYRWHWDFDYHGGDVTLGTSSPYITHTYTQPGTYTVAVKYFSNIASGGNIYTFQVVISNLKRYYYVKDHLGSIRVTVNDTGAVVAYNDYDPWGMQLDGRSGNSGLPNEKYKFTGKERDQETGYDYFGARYYDSRIARWMGVDPQAEKYPDVSTYQYVHNNPMNAYDPNGQWEVKQYNDPLAYGNFIVTRFSSTDRFICACLPFACVGVWARSQDPAYQSGWKDVAKDAFTFGFGKCSKLLAEGTELTGRAIPFILEHGGDITEVTFRIAENLGEEAETPFVESTLFNTMQKIHLGEQTDNGFGSNSTFHLSAAATQGLTSAGQVAQKVKALENAIRNKAKDNGYDLRKESGRAMFSKYLEENSSNLSSEWNSVWQNSDQDN